MFAPRLNLHLMAVCLISIQACVAPGGACYLVWTNRQQTIVDRQWATVTYTLPAVLFNKQGVQVGRSPYLNTCIHLACDA